MIATGQNVVASDFNDLIPVGSVFPFAGASAPTGYLICNGVAVSRATYAALFAVISTTYGAGDGSTTFNLPDMRGRGAIGVGTGTTALSFDAATDVDPSTDLITVPSNSWLVTGQAVVLAGSSLPTGLSAGTYYVVRISATTIKLATSLANAQNATVVDVTADGSGAATLTQTLTARTLAEKGGEESHAMSATEQLAHSHTLVNRPGNQTSSHQVIATTTAQNINEADSMIAKKEADAGTRDARITNTGGNEAMNVMQPFLSLNYIIRHLTYS